MSASTYAAPTAALVPLDAGERVRAFGNEILLKLTGDETAGAMSLGLATVPPGSSGPPLHVHETEDEVFIIVEGEYRVFVDGAWTTVVPGGVAFLPRGVPHTFEVVSATGGRHWVVTTSSAFASFFRDSAAVFDQPGPPDRARLGAIAAANGMRFVVPARAG